MKTFRNVPWTVKTSSFINVKRNVPLYRPRLFLETVWMLLLNVLKQLLSFKKKKKRFKYNLRRKKKTVQWTMYKVFCVNVLKTWKQHFENSKDHFEQALLPFLEGSFITSRERSLLARLDGLNKLNQASKDLVESKLRWNFAINFIGYINRLHYLIIL